MTTEQYQIGYEEGYQEGWNAAMGETPLYTAPAVPHMSAAEVNNLPAHVRAYIHQLVSLCDPAGLVRENAQLLDTNNALQKMYRRAADACAEVFGCFAAAEIEGLRDALSDTTDEHLKDLVERRLMYAMHAVRDIAASPPAEQQIKKPNVVLELPDGDTRVAEVFFSEMKGDTLHLCITVTEQAAQQAAPEAAPGEPVRGDVLPPVGSRVYIRHGRDNDAHACTVTGYYAWGDLGGDKWLHRVFVRLVYEGTDRQQARMLCDCYPTAEAALAEAAPQQEAQEPYGYVYTVQVAPIVGDERKVERTVFTRIKPPCYAIALYAAHQPAPAPLREQDEALIRQMLDALENHDGNYKLSKSAGAIVDVAITAARKRLENT